MVPEFRNSIGWEAKKSNLYSRFGDRYIKAEQFKVMTRSDNGEALGIVAPGYRNFSNAEFSEITNDFVKLSNNSLKLEGFHEFKNGSIVLAYLRNAKPGTIAGEKFDDFVVIGNSFNRETALFFGSVMHILSCENQFGRIHQNIRVIHTPNMETKIKEIKKAFELYFLEKEKMLKIMEAASKVKIDDKIVEEMINYLFNLENEETKETGKIKVENGIFTFPEEITTNKQNKIISLKEAVDIETSQKGETLWGWFNGVTRYTTHNKTEKIENPFGNLYGGKNGLNQKAFNFIAQMV